MEKQQRHICRLCLRRFPNGRALGGHMRSHARADPSPSFSSNSSGSGYVLRGNLKRSFRLADLEFSSVESEYASCRPKRPRNEEVASSASETTTDEDVALCLVMLSRDVWHQEDRHPGGLDAAPLADEDEEEEEQQQEQEQPEELRPAKAGGKFQCSTCKKCFKSYQALGGHRASHNKSKTCAPPIGDCRIRNAAPPPPPPPDQQRIHECPYCHKVFQSGQALGGHKRSHHLPSAIRRSPVPERMIDLNLPAPPEESESFIDCSALSDDDH